MPDVLVRNVDDKMLIRLKERAEKHGRSLQNELIHLLSTLVNDEPMSDEATAARIRRSLRGRKFNDSAVSLREDRAR